SKTGGALLACVGAAAVIQLSEGHHTTAASVHGDEHVAVGCDGHAPRAWQRVGKDRGAETRLKLEANVVRRALGDRGRLCRQSRREGKRHQRRHRENRSHASIPGWVVVAHWRVPSPKSNVLEKKGSTLVARR